MRAAPLLLLLVLVGAGCLQEAAPSSGNASAPGGTLPLPTDATAKATLPPGVLYQREHVFDAAGANRVDTVRVPNGTAALRFEVRFGALPAQADVAVRLYAPEGELRAKCLGEACDQLVEPATPGAWTVEYAGVAVLNASVTLRIAAQLPTPTPVTPTAPTPAPTPTPPPTPPSDATGAHEAPPAGTPVTLHRNQRASDGPDALVVVEPGYSWLRLEVEANGSFPGPVSLVPPAGNGGVACSAPGCALNVAAPESGSWHVRYSEGVPDDVTATVLGYRVDASRYKQVVDVTERTNRTDFLAVLPGVARVHGVVLVQTTSASSSFPPEVLLVAPNGTAAFSCRARCDLDLGVVEGLWRVGYQGSGAGTAYVNFSLEGTPKPTTSYTLYDSGHHYPTAQNRGVFGEGFLMPTAASHWLFAVDWTLAPDPASTAAVEVRDPTGALVARCARAEQQACTFEGLATAGLWDARYVGADAATAVRTYAKAA